MHGMRRVVHKKSGLCIILQRPWPQARVELTSEFYCSPYHSSSVPSRLCRALFRALDCYLHAAFNLFSAIMLLIRTRALIWPPPQNSFFVLSLGKKKGKDGSASRLNSRTWIVLSYDDRRRLQNLFCELEVVFLSV